MSFEAQDVERKELAIMKILGDSKEPLGSRVITRLLKTHGVELSERAVRYHLKLMDERGLTRLVGWRDGRVLTEAGSEEAGSALVKDKVGFAISGIELLAFQTDFDYEQRTGKIPINISYFPKAKFDKALHLMKPAFDAGLCVSNRVAIASEKEQLGSLIVPKGKMGLGTVCSIVFNGALLKAGVPMNSRFGGILQVRDYKPLRFVELINYAGSSLDPSEIFIRARMTSVREVARSGDGKMLANFRDIPGICRPVAETVIAKMKEMGLRGPLAMGETSESVCETVVDMNKIGVVLIGGLNPVAAAAEAGIDTVNHAMSTVMEYQDLVEFEGVLR